MAEQNAIEVVRKRYRCTYGVKVIACDRIERGMSYTSMASCSTSSGRNDTKYTAHDSGNSMAMSQQKAREAVMSKYRCTYGVNQMKTSSGYDLRTYCVAGCTTSSGRIDSRYTDGATGNNEVEAEALAFQKVKKRYNCTYGIKIQNCSQ